jgi:hypothetical protein
MNPELKKLEATLGRLAIRSASIDRDELMYQSGWAAATDSLASEAAVAGSGMPAGRVQTWVWPVTAMLTSAATIMLAVLLVIQSNNPPVSTNNQQVASGQDFRTEPDSANLKFENDRTEVEKSATPDETYGEPDLVKRILDFPAGQVLKSGLAFQTPDPASKQVGPSIPGVGPASVMESPVGQRELLEELLPTRRQIKPVWPDLFF